MNTTASSVLLNARKRLSHEYRLIRSQYPFFLLCAVVMTYGSTMVFRNLAFYRYEARPRLKDVGFDVLPDLENNEFWSGVSDIPMQASVWAMVLTSVCSVLFGSSAQATPYAVNMLRRVLGMLSLGHVLRFGTYISTTVPGTSENCLPGHLDEIHPRQPTSMREVFLTRLALDPGNNCGDLMFSGHILGIVTPVLMVQMYGRRCLVETKLMSDCNFRALLALLWSLIACQAVLIVMMRNHYTSDVVVSSYLTPLLWSFYCRVLQPSDLELVEETEAISEEEGV